MKNLVEGLKGRTKNQKVEDSTLEIIESQEQKE